MLVAVGFFNYSLFIFTMHMDLALLYMYLQVNRSDAL